MQSSMALVSTPAAVLGCNANAERGGGIVRLPLAPLAPRRAPVFRCQASENGDQSHRTARGPFKQEITRDGILRHQETDQPEKQSVFGAVPSSGSLYPRPEVERRPETGDRSFGSIFAFDGAAPETIIYGRLVRSLSSHSMVVSRIIRFAL
ncbi:unnamed protein product [Calypogeia fissa]